MTREFTGTLLIAFHEDSGFALVCESQRYQVRSYGSASSFYTPPRYNAVCGFHLMPWPVLFFSSREDTERHFARISSPQLAIVKSNLLVNIGITHI